jgi:hypothetical protein
MQDTVFMRSPQGEIREVDPTPEVLTPLMAAGWHQHHMISGEPVEFPGAPKLEPAAPGEPGVIGEGK